MSKLNNILNFFSQKFKKNKNKFFFYYPAKP